jgi:antitoxin MazE
VQADIVKIGNSRGIRIPAYILKECKIEREVELKVQEGKIIITPVKSTRAGWNKKFKQMHEDQDDILLVDEKVDIELEDWKW